MKVGRKSMEHSEYGAGSGMISLSYNMFFFFFFRIKLKIKKSGKNGRKWSPEGPEVKTFVFVAHGKR